MYKKRINGFKQTGSKKECIDSTGNWLSIT